MTVPNVVEQAEWVTPPVSGALLVITLDSTSREYDLSLANLGVAFGAGHDGEYFYVQVAADGCDCYLTFSAASGKTVDDTAALGAGSAVSGFTANGADVVFQSTVGQFYIQRLNMRYLQLKSAAGKAGKARIRVSSSLRPGASESNG
jgi:hypothetical protein